jgi:branched-chain amino acid transport system substrate-binding protein
VLIGASLSLTGDFSGDGQAFQQGYNLWAADQNKNGGLLGHKIELKILNDTSTPTQVVTNYQALISSDHVNLTFGPFSSLLTLPAARAVSRYGYAMVEGAGGAPSVFQAGLRGEWTGAVRAVARLAARQSTTQDDCVRDVNGPVHRATDPRR